MAGVWLAVAGAVAVWLLWPDRVEPGEWGGPPGWAGPIAVGLAVVAGFLLGATLATRFPALRRPFVPRAQAADAVAAAARGAFFDRRAHHTAGATGVLIFVSLEERRADVLADREALSAAGEDVCDELCDALTAALAADHSPDGVCAAVCGTVAEAGRRLAGPLPRLSGDANELGDALVLLAAP